MKTNLDEKEIYKQLKNDRRLMLLSTASLISVVVILFLLVIYGLYRINIIKIPFINTPETVENPQNYNEIDNKMFELFQNISVEKQAVFFDINKEDLLNLLVDAPYIKEYSLVQNIHYRNHSDASRITYRNEIWVKNDKYRVDTYLNSGLIRQLICDGKQIAVTDYVTYEESATKIYPVTAEFTFENQSGLPSIAEFMNKPGIIILDIKIVREQLNNAYLVQYIYEDIPQEETLTISFDYGLILTAESKYDRATVYNMNTTNTSYKVNDKIFEIN